ncbi:MAG: hypothetical protein ACW9W3_01085 [Candidatus Nitrosopumilus sp. bin_68KS]
MINISQEEAEKLPEYITNYKKSITDMLEIYSKFNQAKGNVSKQLEIKQFIEKDIGLNHRNIHNFIFAVISAYNHNPESCFFLAENTIIDAQLALDECFAKFEECGIPIVRAKLSKDSL